MVSKKGVFLKPVQSSTLFPVKPVFLKKIPVLKRPALWYISFGKIISSIYSVVASVLRRIELDYITLVLSAQRVTTRCACIYLGVETDLWL